MDCLQSHITQGPKQQVGLWSFKITHLIFLKNEIEQPERALTEEDQKVHQLRCDYKRANQFSHKVDDAILFSGELLNLEIFFSPLSLSLSPFCFPAFLHIHRLTCQIKHFIVTKHKPQLFPTYQWCSDAKHYEPQEWRGKITLKVHFVLVLVTSVCIYVVVLSHQWE